MTIDLYSDVVCPWCYIGERRLDAAIELLAAPTDDLEPLEVKVRLRAFQLDPDADPKRVEPVIDAYARKFGGPQRATEIIEQVTAVAASEGLEFHLDRAIRANTLMAHRLIWWAGQPDSPVSAEEMNTAIMRAYFTDGRNIANPETLVGLAADLGADAETVRGFLSSDHGSAEVAADLASAAEQGVTAVPTVVIDGWGIAGAQDADTFARLIRKAAGS